MSPLRGFALFLAILYHKADVCLSVNVDASKDGIDGIPQSDSIEGMAKESFGAYPAHISGAPLSEFVLPSRLDEIMQKFWLDRQWYDLFLTDKLNGVGVEVGDWIPVHHEEQIPSIKGRKVFSSHPFKFTFPGMPTAIESHKEQFMAEHLGDSFIIRDKNYFRGIPFGDYFHVHWQWVLSPHNTTSPAPTAPTASPVLPDPQSRNQLDAMESKVGDGDGADAAAKADGDGTGTCTSGEGGCAALDDQCDSGSHNGNNSNSNNNNNNNNSSNNNNNSGCSNKRRESLIVEEDADNNIHHTKVSVHVEIEFVKDTFARRVIDASIRSEQAAVCRKWADLAMQHLQD